MAQKNFKVNNGLTTPVTTFLYDDGNVANTRTVNVAPSSSTTANYSLTLPVDDGSSGQVLTTDGSGILTWSSPAGIPSSIVNGNSNVVVNANANVTISSAGNANVVVVTGTGANITGTLDVTANANVGNLGTATAIITTGNITTVNTGLVQNGNSNVTLSANANVTISSNGQSNIVTVSSDATNGLVAINGNLTANNFATTGSAGNISGANVIGANKFQTTSNGAVVFVSNNSTSTQQVTLQSSTDAAFTANYTLTLPVNDGTSGQVLATDGSGILSWASVSTSSLVNGNSNVVVNANANVTISSAGNANIVVVTGTGANITGTLDVTANANVGNLGTATAIITTGNITTVNTGLVQNGNSNVAIAANANVSIASNGVANVVTITNGNLITGNGVGFVLKSNNGTDIRQVQLKTSTDSGFLSNYSLTLPVNDGVAGQSLITDGSGILSWESVSTSIISNGNSNVSVPVANGNVNISSAGNANVFIVTGVGAIVNGPANIADTVTAQQAVFKNGDGAADFSGTQIAFGFSTTTQYQQYIHTRHANNQPANNAIDFFTSDGNANGIFPANAILGLTVSNAKIGVNISTPTSTLHVVGDANITSDILAGGNINANTFKTTANGAVIFVSNNGTSTQQVTLQSSTAAGFTANYSLTLPTTDGTPGQHLETDGNGILSWSSVSPGSLVNGNSNVVVEANANVTISSAGNANVVVVTGTGANVTGTLNVTANANVGNLGTTTAIITTGNITTVNTGLVQNGNSNIAITSNANITLTAKSNATVVITDTGANVTGTANITGDLRTGGNLTVDGTGVTSIAGNINMNGKWVGNIGYAVADTDAASKLYVDTLVSTGISYHAPVNAATTTTLDTATGGTAAYNEPNGAGNGIGAYISTTGTFTTIDSVTINGSTSIRILVKNEANAAWNGVYNYTNANAITRTTDTDEYGAGNIALLSINDYFFTQAGAVNAGTAFIVSAPTGTITFGTSNIEFSVFSTSPVYTGGTGITVSGTVISANAIQSQVTQVGTLGNLDVTGNTTSGNFIGIFANGNSNVSIPAANGNVNISAVGNANVLVVTGTGANITGTLNVTSNINGGTFQNGNSSVVITANANVNISSNGQSNIVTISSDATNGLVTINGNLAANNFTTTGATGNITGANVVNANTFKTAANGAVIFVSNNGTNLQQVTLQSSTNAGFTSNYTLTLPINDGASGQVLITDGSGVLSWENFSPSSLVNGNSNVVVNANANVTISSAGNANVVVVTGTDTLFSSNVEVGAVNANSSIVFNANTFQTKIFASNAAVANYSLYLPANVASTNGLSLVANTDGTLRFASVFTPQATIKFTAATTGNNQTFTDANIANFGNVTAFSSVYRNGVLVDSSDYAFSDTTLTMNVQLVTGDTIAIASTNMASASSGGVAGGSNTQVQFNDSGAFGGDSGFTYNKTTDVLTIGNLAYSGGVGNVTVAGNTWSFGNISGIPAISLAQGGGNTYITAPPSNNITILTQNGGAAAGWSGVQLIDQGSVWIYTQNQTKNWEFANTGILNAPGNINAPALVNGNSSVAITSNANITLTAASNATMVITGTGANITGTAGVSGNIQSFFANVSTSNTASFMATGSNTVGGTTFLDFLFANNTSNATSGRKTFRIDGNGKLEIIDSAYSISLLNLTDSGNLSIAGTYSVAGKQAVNGPAFAAYANATLQTITSGSQQKVLFQTEEYDTNNNFASSTFTPTVEGYYQLNAEVRLDGASGTGEFMIVLYKNGSEYKRGTNQSGTQIASSFWAMQVSSLAYANGTTDYFEIFVQQTSGSSVTVTAVNNVAITWFNGCMVRGA